MMNTDSRHRLIWGAIFIIFTVFVSGFTRSYGQTESIGFDPCLHMTPADGALFLAISTGELRVIRDRQLPNRCVIRSCKESPKVISFSVYRESSAEAASKDLATVRNGLRMISRIEAVPNLGDEAALAPGDMAGRLLVRRKNFFIDILLPKDPVIQKKLAAFLLSRL